MAAKSHRPTANPPASASAPEDSAAQPAPSPMAQAPATSWSLEAKVRTAFTLAFGLLVVIFLTSLHNLQQVQSVSQLHEETHRIVRALDTFLALTRQVQLGLRGYVLTGDDSFLDLYRQGLDGLKVQCRQLEDFRRLRPDHRAELQEFKSVVGQWTEQVPAIVAARQAQGIAAAQQLFQAQTRQQQMDRFQVTVERWEAEEGARLTALDQRQKTTAQRHAYTVIGGGLMAMVLVALAGVLLSREVASRRQAQAALETSNRQLDGRVRERTAAIARTNAELQTEIGERRRAEAAAQRTNRTLRTLSECNQALVRASDETALFQDVCRILVQYGGYQRAWVGLTGPDTDPTVHPVASVPGPNDANPTPDTRAAAEPDSEAVNAAIRTRQPVVVREAGPISNPTPESPAEAAPEAAAITVPLVGETKVLGALHVAAAPSRVVDDVEVKQLEELAADLAFGLGGLRTRAENERLHRLNALILQRMPIGCVLFDRQFRFYSVNPAAESIFGYDPGGLSGADPYQTIVPPKWHGHVRDVVRRLFQGDMTAHSTNENVTRDGRTILCDWFNTPLKNEQGEVEWLVCMVQDVTEARRLGDALKESEEMFQTLFAAVEEVVWSATADGQRMLFLNAAAEKVYGRPAAEFTRNPQLWREVVYPADQPVAAAKVRDLYRHGSAEAEYRVVRPDGSIRWIHDYTTLVRDANGQPVRMGGITQDITERKESDEALRQSERNYREIFNAVNDALFIHDAATGQIVDVNETTLRMFGLTRDQALRLSPNDTSLGTSPYSATEAQQWLAKAVEEGPQVFEWRARKHSGELFWVEVALKRAVLNDAERVLALVRDITYRKQAEAELQSTQQRLQDIIEHSTNLFFMHTVDHVLTYVSPQTRQFFDCDPETALVKWTEFLTDNPANAIGLASTQRAIDTRQPQPPYQLELKGRRNRVIWVEVREAPVVRDGRTVAIVGSLTDITERKQAEKNLRDLTIHLLQVQDEERRHLGRELHDSTSQTLAALEINLSLLNRAAEQWDGRTRRLLVDSLELVEQSSHQIRTMSYLLHPPLLDEVGLASALRWYADGFAERSGIELDLDLPADLGRLPQLTELTLFRIIQECLANIHRHSGSPRAWVQLLRADGELRLTVRDEGSGMSAETLRAVQGQGGQVGVGLAGMRERLRPLAGQLEIASSPQGTRITVVLPMDNASA